MNYIIVCAILCLPLSAAAPAAANPFLTPERTQEQVVSEEPATRVAVPGNSAFGFMVTTQRRLHENISAFSRQLKDEPRLQVFLLLFGVAFLYGVVHAAGPGHGKAFAVSYFIAEKNSLKNGVALGVLIAFMHAGSAIVLVLIIFGFFKSAVLSRVDNTSHVIALFSYGLIACIGLVMLIRSSLQKKPAAGTPDTSRSGLISVGVSAGMVPCPGTVVLLVFSISIEMLWLGIYLALAVAVGMSVTIACVGIAAITSRRVLLDRGGRARGMQAAFSRVCTLAGYTMITLLGATLFFTNL